MNPMTEVYSSCAGMISHPVVRETEKRLCFHFSMVHKTNSLSEDVTKYYDPDIQPRNVMRKKRPWRK